MSRSNKPPQHRQHQRQNPPGWLTAPLEDLNHGKKFRVRDDDTLFGFDLPWAEAFKLKDQIAGRRISTTVMTEEMNDEETPDWVREQEQIASEESQAVKPADPDLEQLRSPAKLAAASAAAAANARAAAKARAPRVVRATLPPAAPAATPIPVVVDEAFDSGDLDVNDALDGLGSVPTDEEIADMIGGEGGS